MASDHRHLLGSDVLASDGAKLGHIADVYVDADSGIAKWLVLSGGLLSNAVSFVPAEGSREDEDGRIVAAYTRKQVRRAPHPEADGELSVEEEEALARHYLAARQEAVELHEGDDDTLVGVDPGLDPTVPGEEWLTPPGPAATSADGGEISVVRSEEELEVGTATRVAGRARLVKRIVTEEVTITVPVRREVLELVSEDVPEEEALASDPTMAPGVVAEAFAPMPDQEFVLYAEIVEYSKRIVPRERVRLVKQVVEEAVDVRADLRKERVEVEESDRTGDLRAPVRPSA